MMKLLPHSVKTIFIVLLLVASPTCGAVIGDTVVCAGVAQDSAGKIVTAGRVLENNTLSVFVSRYTSAGMIDTSFGSSGTTVTSIGSEHSQVLAVTVQSDDKIVIAGIADGQIALARYTTSGTLDTSFGTGGIVQTTVGSRSEARALAIDGSGNIVVGGITIISGLSYIVLARYTSAGVLDSSFGTGGIVTETVNLGVSCLKLALDGSGNIFVTGGTHTSGESKVALAKFDSSGILDASFGSSGFVATAVGNGALAYSIVVNGTSIYIAGISDGYPLLAKYTLSGALDTSFGPDNNGIVVDTALGFSRAFAVREQTDGKLVVACQGQANSLFVARYNQSTGSREALFGTHQGFVQDLLLESDDKAIICGTNPAFDALLIRYTTAGDFDTSFGYGGIQNLPAGRRGLVGAVTFLYDEKSAGTNGGGFTSGSWQTRELNTIFGDRGRASLVSNEFTVEPGVYKVRIQAPAYNVGLHAIRLYDVTNSRVVEAGTSACSLNDVTSSTLEYMLTVGQATILRVEHQCQTTNATDGFGLATGFTGTSERYTSVVVEFLGN